MSHLGDHFRACRVEKGLTTGQLARMVGYENTPSKVVEFWITCCRSSG